MKTLKCYIEKYKEEIIRKIKAENSEDKEEIENYISFINKIIYSKEEKTKGIFCIFEMEDMIFKNKFLSISTVSLSNLHEFISNKIILKDIPIFDLQSVKIEEIFNFYIPNISIIDYGLLNVVYSILEELTFFSYEVEIINCKNKSNNIQIEDGVLLDIMNDIMDMDMDMDFNEYKEFDEHESMFIFDESYKNNMEEFKNKALFALLYEYITGEKIIIKK